ncbi:MAG TPA: hypothetical protein VHX52_05320 [Steroidobacteraceae bacterium]|nr:hypothetical protein [Steroidobacteraceae bacterium]
MAKSKSTAPTEAQSPSERPLPDRKTIEERLAAATRTIYEAQAIVANAQAAVRDMDNGDGSDPDYALAVACRMLNKVAGDVEPVAMLARAEAQEVAHV